MDLIAKGWNDYELIDSGHGQRLERFGNVTVVRPDPNVLWQPSCPDHEGWRKPDLRFLKEKKDWQGKESLKDGWIINYDDLKFSVQPTPFRHVGVFPEQHVHWQWLREAIREAAVGGRKLRVLNLFAYTGAASVVAAAAGAEVCHVDASKASVYKAKDNARNSGLPEDAIRWIVDDVEKFLKREVNRGKEYDIIIMDPPVFGRGPKGEIWRIEEGIASLSSLAGQLFSSKPVGLLVNLYATSLYVHSAQRLFEDACPGLQLESGTLFLEESSTGKKLPTGFFIRTKILS